MPDLRHDVQEVVSQGSRVVARTVVTGTLHGEFAGISARGASFQIDQSSSPASGTG